MREHCKHFFDILIVGGGMTGTSSSILLHKEGYKVGLIEKTYLNKFKQGESLSPECRRYLSMLDLPLSPSYASDYYGIKSVWGNPDGATSSFIFNPFGNGLSIDREAVEQELITYSISMGNTIYLGMVILGIRFWENNWEIEIKYDNASLILKSRFLVFATGRNSPLNPIASRKKYMDRLVALTVVSKFGCLDKDILKQLEIESIPEGWFYTNILPNQKRIYSIFTDGDLVPSRKKDFFLDTLSSTCWYRNQTTAELGDSISIKVSDARTSWSFNQSGHCWLELGDSAYTIDPLSGLGILKNFEMIEFAISKIRSFFLSGIDFEKEYFRYNQENFTKYMAQKEEVYQMEQRWIRNPFWTRRNKRLLRDTYLTK